MGGVKRKVADAIHESACASADDEAPVQSSPLVVAFYCRAGKHRSVACSVILEHIFRAEGWDCPAPKHLSSPKWSKGCCKGQCYECKEPPEYLYATLHTALEMWHQIRILV